MQNYTVQAGDTLCGIGKQFGVSAEQIKEVNQLGNNNIVPGQVLKIPEMTSTSTNIYTVMPGDSLYSIAEKYHTTVEELMRLNQLTSTLLTVGQKLTIPGNENITPITYEVYTVKSGDNLYDIANTYNMTVQELMAINNLTSTNLALGQQLKVKSSSIPGASLEECYGEGYVEPKYLEYTVQKGDSLYIIANKYNTTVEKLMELNDLSNINLSIGQVLKVREI